MASARTPRINDELINSRFWPDSDFTTAYQLEMFAATEWRLASELVPL